MNNYCIGIDPGDTGAIVCVKSTGHHLQIQWAEPMPVVKWKDRTLVDVPLFERLMPGNSGIQLILELPQTGFRAINPASQAVLNTQCGQIITILWSQLPPLEIVYPSVWRHYFRLPKKGDKAANRKWAESVFGRDAALKYFTGPRGGTSTREGQVDAALIAAYWLTKTQGESK